MVFAAGCPLVRGKGWGGEHVTRELSLLVSDPPVGDASSWALEDGRGDTRDVSWDGWLISSKLNRPAGSYDLVPRPGLASRMDLCLKVPATLISAPAGYGKTTLASQWLETCPAASAWVSLDEQDDHLATFVTYVLSAVQSCFPHVGEHTLSLARSASFAGGSHLFVSFVNELNRIDEPFVLVLDDLHCVRDPKIIDFLTELVVHPPRNFHLVMIGRWDPPLPVSRLRGRGKLLEVGVADLRFSASETRAYLRTALDEEVPVDVADALHGGTEGWIAGIRLAVLSARTAESLAGLVAEAGPSSYVTGYLFDEVLSALPADLAPALLSVSTLDRFCPELLDAMWQVEGSDSALEELSLDPQLTGRDFLNWAEGEHLFLIRLDEEGRWFRLHHLVKALLAEELTRRCSEESRGVLRRRADTWFREQGLMNGGAPGQDTRHVPSSSDPVGLTLRETEILALVARGKSNKRVARDLSISVETVKKHVYNVFRKLDVNNRVKAVEKARALGILEPWYSPSPPFPSPFPEG